MGADFDNYEMEEESSFSNTKGFFSLCSQLMFSATHAEINNDLHKLNKCLHALYGWMIANYNPQEREQTRNKFQNIINNLQEMNKYHTNGADKKANQHYQLAGNLLQEIKQELVEKMHDKNLLYPVREKGSALWN